MTADNVSLDAQPLELDHHESGADPKTSGYARALAAWNRGNPYATLSLLESLPTNRQTAESLLLCARALIRKDRLADAREWLTRSVSSHRTVDNHATQLMLQGVIEGRERNGSAAEVLFARALDLKAHHRLRAEINYERAVVQVLHQRHDEARSTLRAIRPYSDVVSVRAIELEGRIDSTAGDYRSAHAAFGAALAELDKCAAIDMSLRASLLCAFSEMVAELDHDQGERLVYEWGRVTWSQSVVREQVQTLRYTGLVHRRAGRLDDAMQLFGEASSVAPGSPWQILGVAECACLCIDQNNSWAARGYVAQAERLAEQIEWATVSGEQRVALLALAQALARLKEGGAARTLVERFQLTAQSEAPRCDGQINDERPSTYTRHTMGLVHAACGDVATGREALSGVHRAWSRIGYRWRALDALNDIKRIDPRRMPDVLLDGASEVHRKLLVGEDRTLARPGNQASGAALRERFARQYDIKSLRLADILQLAVRGRSNEEIALELGLAERTVKNKVIQLYGIVGVKSRGTNSRAELVARCMADIAAL